MTEEQIVERRVCTIGDKVFWIVESDLLWKTHLVEEFIDDIESRMTVSWYDVTDERTLHFIVSETQDPEKCMLNLIKKKKEKNKNE